MIHNPIFAQPVVRYPDFGPYLTYIEATKSATAIRMGIANTPTQEQYTNMVLVYHHLLIPLFDRFGKLPIRSFFRCPALNRAEGGSPSSSHLLGLAVDIDCDSMRTVSNRQIYEWARRNINCDQLILHHDEGFSSPVWVHLSYSSRKTDQSTRLKSTNPLIQP